jgi:exopolysaccharide biosynthesis predicted pyruvyltransferase EpsI
MAIKNIYQIENFNVIPAKDISNVDKVPNSFELKLQAHREAIVNFIGQKQPLWLLSEMPGNIGDHLIWAGTERMLILSGLAYESVAVHDLRKIIETRPGTLIIPGSGAFVSRWHEWLPDVVIHSSSVYERVVILPSQFDTDVPIVHKALQLQNVYPFAREVDSYSKIKKLGKAVLALDPALWAIEFTPAQLKNDTLNCKTLIALRTDQGSRLGDHGFAPAAQNNDIGLTCSNLCDFIQTIKLVDIIITDRLHVMVAAIMLGKQIKFIDPYDQKISRYIEFNFGREFSNQLSHTTIEWLLANQYIQLEEGIT